jgi:hypothetical protein
VPFKFVQSYSPNFYDGKGESFTGYINAKAGEILRQNNYLERNAYPLVPSFSFKYILSVLLEKYEYSISDDNWLAFENEYFCSMIDMAQQIEGTDLAFNVYAEKIRYNMYMPDMTVREFFESFLLLVGCAPIFDSSRKTFLLKPFSGTLTEDPLLIGAAQEMGVDFESTKNFGYSYKEVQESETKTDALKGFFELQNAENITKIEQPFLPLAPKPANEDRRRTAAPRAGGTWIGTTNLTTDNIITFAETKGKSVMFGLSEAAIPRVFTLKSNQADSSAYGLNAPDGFYLKNILPILLIRTGKVLGLETKLTKLEVSKLSTLRKIHYRGAEWLLNQFTAAIDNSNYCKVTLELERVKG